jgi:hypothetical protein
MSETVALKKRSKKKIAPDDGGILNSSTASQNIQIVIDEVSVSENAIEANPLKKRGRKPKGGKLVVKSSDNSDKPPVISNVILHLKCSLKDLDEYNNNMNRLVTNPLNYNPDVPPNIMTYNPNDSSSFSKYEINKEENDIAYIDTNISSKTHICSECTKRLEDNELINDNVNEDYDDINIKDVNQKLKKLKMNLYKNSLNDKKSACFWCTYEFDNQTCYIPRYEIDGEICGYGSFCRPECAVAYLMKESIDDSTKFERYHLLNQIYSKVYDFKKNIKPAPNPYFLLEKFYGNLSIQEYRKLLKTEHMLLVIDKPLTRILPELHEDTDDFIMGIYGGSKGLSLIHI